MAPLADGAIEDCRNTRG